MKKILFAVVLFIILSSPCFSAYIIELENGSRFTTSQYWEEGDMIKCYLYGGVTAFQKKDVKTIRLSDKPYVWEEPEPEPMPEEDMGNQEQPADTDEASEATEKATDESEPPPPITEAEKADFLQQKIAIADQYKEVSEEFEAAKEAGTEEDKEAAMKRFLDVREKEAALVETVKKRNDGTLPDWWAPSTND